MSVSTRHSDVVVVGGGMAGLAAAYALSLNGASVTVLEQASEFAEVGAGLQLGPNASRVLAEWGLLDQALAVGVRPRHLVFRDAIDGAELTRQTLGGEFERRYGAPYVVIHRSDLHSILLEACREAGVSLLTGVRVEDVETTGSRTTVSADGGLAFTADAVVGADGIRSRLRRLVSRDDVVPSSYVAYRGTVPITTDTPRGDLDDVVVYLGPECHLVQYPLRSGEILNTVAVFRSSTFEHGIEQYDGVDELQSAYAECVPEVRAALANVGTGMRWPMYDREPIDDWSAGSMLLIGDAAHPMLQYLAQGACQALEDAEALQRTTRSSVFTPDGVDADGWAAAASTFVRARADRVARVQRTARQWGEAWHVTGIGRQLRNMLFRDNVDGSFRYTDWLYAKSS